MDLLPLCYPYVVDHHVQHFDRNLKRHLRKDHGEESLFCNQGADRNVRRFHVLIQVHELQQVPQQEVYLCDQAV